MWRGGGGGGGGGDGGFAFHNIRGAGHAVAAAELPPTILAPSPDGLLRLTTRMSVSNQTATGAGTRARLVSDPAPRRRSFAKQAAMQLAAGGSAGETNNMFVYSTHCTFISILIGHAAATTFLSPPPPPVFLISGCIEVSLMHPLDLVKTRFQLQSTATVPAANQAGKINLLQ